MPLPPPLLPTLPTLDNRAVDRAVAALHAAIGAGEFMPGTSLPAERSLAERLDVSRVTVRAALLHLEHQGLIGPNPHGRGRIVRQASSKVPVRSDDEDVIHRSIVFLTYLDPGHHLTSAPWWQRADAALLAELHRRGHTVLTVAMAVGHPPAPSEIDALVRSHPRGIAFGAGVDWLPEALEMARTLHRAGVPIVSSSDEPGWDDFHHVVSDQALGADLLVQSLHDRGCQTILQIDQGAPPTRWMAERHRGYREAVHRLGLLELPTLPMPSIPEGPDDEHWYDLRRRLLAGHLVDRLTFQGTPVDAILAVSDWLIFPIAGACRLLGREPGRDPMIAGFDHYWYSCPARRWDPIIPAATIDRDDEARGVAMADLLLAPDAATAPSRHVVLSPRLVSGPDIAAAAPLIPIRRNLPST